MMQSRIKKYSFVNANLRAKLSKMTSDALFEQMMKERSLPEAIRLLHDTSFKEIEEVYNSTGDLRLAELELYKKEMRLFTEIESFLSGEVLDFVKSLTCRYEINNLKTALRLWFDRVIRGRNIDDSIGYVLRNKIHYDLKVDQIINTDSIYAIAGILAATPYGAIINENASAVEKERTIFSVEMALDAYYYKHLMEKTDELDRIDKAIAKRLLGVEIDVDNLAWMIRSKNFYRMSMKESLRYVIPFGYKLDRKILEEVYECGDAAEIVKSVIGSKYALFTAILNPSSSAAGSESKLMAVERFLDQIILYEVRRIKGGDPFNIGIILAYFILKRNEIRKIMTILNAKYYRIPENRIKSII